MFFYYLNNFLFFSIFGYFFETSIFTILDMHKYSGFMYLWWTPFYGCGVLLAILANKLIDKYIQNKKAKLIVLFISLFILTTLLEFIGGHLLKLSHGYSLWSYKSIPLHMGKYVSVPTSLAWSSMAIVYLKFIKNYSDKIIKRIPKWITILLTLIFITDYILTTYKLIYRRM